MKKLILLIGVILFLGCIDQSEDVSLLPREEVLEIHENNISGEISIDFQNYNGFIEVHIWDKPSYRVELVKWARAATSEEAKKMAENLKVDFSEKIEIGGITLVLETEEKITAGVEVTAYLPGMSFEIVDLSTFNGDIWLDDVTASDVSLTCANGDIRGSATADTIRVKTSNGKVQGFYQGNDVTIETTNGRIDIECGEYGEYDIGTTNGDIDIIVTGDFKFNLKTTMGDIFIEADDVIYILDDRTHKKGYTAEDYQVVVAASTTMGSVTVVKR